MKPWTNPKEEESAIDTFIQSLPNEEMVLITYKELESVLCQIGFSDDVIKQVAVQLGFREFK